MATYETWEDALTDCTVPDQWDLDVEAWPEWCRPHLTDTMLNGENNLPFRLIYAALIERSGLPLSTRAVLQYLARQCGGSNRPDRRCWPKVKNIADGTGASRATVKRAIQAAEDAGWVRVVRHLQKPSDYILDVPEYDNCPCIACREGAHSEPPGYHSEPPEGQSEPLGGQAEPLGVSQRATHLVHSPDAALDPSPDATHLRAAPNGAGADGAEKVPASQDEDQEQVRDGYRRYGAQLAGQVASGERTLDEVRATADALADERRAWFLEGVREVHEGVTADAAS